MARRGGRKSKDDDGTGEDEAALGRHDAWNATVVAEGDLDDLVGVELAEALDEWARVCAAIARTGGAEDVKSCPVVAGSSWPGWRRCWANRCVTATP